MLASRHLRIKVSPEDVVKQGELPDSDESICRIGCLVLY